MIKDLAIGVISLFLPFFSPFSVNAQTKWLDPMEQSMPLLHNRAWNEEIGKSYARIPASTKGVFRDPVYNLGQNSAGLFLSFESNAPQITVKYTVKGALAMPHMTSIGVSGVDLYVQQPSSQWGYVSGTYIFADTISFTFKNLQSNAWASPREQTFKLFLPLYNSVGELKIGVPEESCFSFIEPSNEKAVVIYGTSICQGGCASRPGMAWTNILHRNIETPVINLGFSGNGRLESEVLSKINEVDARIIILDCLPNLSALNEDEINDLIIAAVKQLREANKCPILLSEHSGCNNYDTDSIIRERIDLTNRAGQRAFATLKQEGVASIYLITMEELNYPADAWVDSVHPTDLGMSVHAKAIEKKIKEIDAAEKLQ